MYDKVSEEQRQLEKDVQTEVDKEKLWKHVEYLCSIGEKFSGTKESQMAVDYFVKSVQEEGVPIDIHEYDSYLSFPSHDRSKDAYLEIIEPLNLAIECQSHAMSGSTPPVELELVDVGPGDLKDYEGIDVRGKIVLVDFAALWAPERMWIAQEKGAAAQITISGDPVIHDMIVTTIWGTPTRESSRRIPKIPIVSIKYEDGVKLREIASKNKVKVKLDVEIWKGWKKVKLPVVTIKGTEYPDEYFLIHGHFCSWGDGMTDNVGGNAQFIEMAKIFWKHRDQLKRGVKIAWWPGHSQGRYSGSTWFVDRFWEDLNRNCIGQMNIDSPGVLGAVLWRASASSELKDFNEYNIKEFSEGFIGETIPTRSSTWVFRAGDQSFTGIGIPRLGCGMSIPNDSPHKGKTTGGGGGGWWWHTLQDTIDKGDKERLPLPMLVNMTSVLRICNTDVLPYNYVPTAQDFIDNLTELHEASKDTIDLSPLLSKAETLKEKAKQLDETLKNSKINENMKKAVNRRLKKVSRILQPAFCTEVDRFDQDLAIRILPLPKLQPIKELADMDQTSDEARFLKTGLVREMNKVSHALSEATEIIEEIQSLIKHPM
jgi:hypothetical protein